MDHLAVVRGLTYTSLAQVFNRWLMPTYRAAFRWTGNRVDSEDATTWVFLKVAGHLQLPDLVQVVDDNVVDATIEAVNRHWVERYGIAPVRCDDISGSESTPAMETLFDGLTGEMRLVLVLRFLRRRSPEAIATQLHIRPDVARRRIIAALARLVPRLGFPAPPSETPQTDYVSAYIDDLIEGRRPVRFDVIPEALPPMIGAGHVLAAIAGNDLPAQQFVRSLQGKLERRTERRLVTHLRIWSA